MVIRTRIAWLMASLFVCGQALTVSAGDWTRFRGPNGSGVSDSKGIPAEWSDSKNLLWKVNLPGPGSSSPIITGNHVLVTCYTGYGLDRGGAGNPRDLTRVLVCVDKNTGEIVWQTPTKADVPEDPYSGFITEHGYATSTPATDGEKVFTFYGKSGVYAFDLKQGKELWHTPVGTGSAQNGWGSGTSLLLFENLVIVHANAESEAIIALDKNTGKQVWKADAQGYRGSWSTPILLDVNGTQELVVAVPGEVWGLNPKTGGLKWYCETGGRAVNCSVVSRDGVVFVLTGGPGGAGAYAIRGGGKDDVTQKNLVWQKSVGAYVPSPVVVGDYLYWVDDNGLAHCHSAETGEEIYRNRLSNAGKVYASAVAADGKLLVVTRQRGTFVIAASKEFNEIAQNEFESDQTNSNAGPAVEDGRIYLRSDKALYCVGSK